MARLSDEEFQQAILNGDFDALDSYSSEFEDEDSEEEQSEKDTANNDESASDDEVKSGDDNASEGDSNAEGNEAKSETDNQEASNKEGESSTPAESADITNSISFDENGNAIIPKELLAVIAKDGKHIIPYELLESARTSVKETKAELQDKVERLARAQADLDKNARYQDLFKQQLVDAGMDPDKLPEDIELTPELLKSLDDYGEIGKVMKALASKTLSSKPTAEEKKPVDNGNTDEKRNQYSEYVRNNAEFSRIMNAEGSDEYETLDLFYTQVVKSPEFKNKPLNEQLDEAMARTNRAFGREQYAAKDEAAISDDNAKAIADEKLKAAAEASTPASPSEVGVSDKGQQKAIDRARGAKGQDLLNIMSELSPAELDALFDDDME